MPLPHGTIRGIASLKRSRDRLREVTQPEPPRWPNQVAAFSGPKREALHAEASHTPLKPARLSSLLFLAYCFWTVPGSFYQSLRFAQVGD